MSSYHQPVAAPDSAVSDQVPSRSEIDARWKWNTSSIFKSEKDWETYFHRLDELVQPLESLRGQLDDPERLADLLEMETRMDRVLESLYTYAHLKADEDTANAEGQARDARIRAKWADLAGRLAWITPQLLALPEETLEAWKQHPRIRENAYLLTRMLRRKPHTLSDAEETLLSRASDIFSAPYKTYSMLTDADMKFPQVEDSDGRTRELSQERYILFVKDPDRKVRSSAFKAMYETYGQYRNTTAQTLSTRVKTSNFLAAVRHYDSALAMSLHDDHVPVSLYDALVDAVHEGLGHFYGYMELRREQLRLPQLDMYDMYVPIVPEFDMHVPYEKARDWVIEACAPLGEEYVSVLASAFQDGWIDVYENRGKRSGAYASGCFDSHPFVLLNYQGTLNDVFTLAHELGHAMHSWLANRSQPHRFASYPIFTAEIASTLNEALLLECLLQKADSPKMKAFLLNHYCDAVKGTVYRQTMFAEFEKVIHEKDAEGVPLTPDLLGRLYGEMNAVYYGPSVGQDSRIELEWSRIPHFYYGFYVYKYATSFCASQLFARQVQESREGRERYLDLLRAGGSDDPLVLIRRAGVDLADRATLELSLQNFGRTVADLRTCLEALPRAS